MCVRPAAVMVRAHDAVAEPGVPSPAFRIAKAGSALQPFLLEDRKPGVAGSAASPTSSSAVAPMLPAGGSAAAVTGSSGNASVEKSDVVDAGASGMHAFLERVHVAYMHASAFR